MKKGSPLDVAALVEAAGGELVGRTRLQKTACLLDLVGAGLGFRFRYHRFGPYSEELSIAASDADALGFVKELPAHAVWGGRYSVFRVTDKARGTATLDSASRELILVATKADSVELELAVTAAFLAEGGFPDAWSEVARLKPSKVTEGRLESAKALYSKFQDLAAPKPLPKI